MWIAYFVEYLVIIIFMMQTFNRSILYIKDVIDNLVDYTYVFLPLLMTLLISTGHYSQISSIEPVILLLGNFIGRFINLFLIPLLMISTVFSIVSNISSDIKIERMSKYFKSFITWSLVFVLTIFSGVISLKSIVAKGVDDLAIKTTKNIVSTTVPVVGKVLSDTTETVLRMCRSFKKCSRHYWYYCSTWNGNSSMY